MSVQASSSEILATEKENYCRMGRTPEEENCNGGKRFHKGVLLEGNTFSDAVQKEVSWRGEEEGGGECWMVGKQRLIKECAPFRMSESRSLEKRKLL